MFMPVATRAAFNNLTIEDVRETGSRMVLGGNTYHMLLAPGLEVIQASGGMHRFMGWEGPLLTDSGGFQVFSLGQLSGHCICDETGAYFTHPHTQAQMCMTPESSIQAQRIIGANVMMAFDQCTPDNIDHAQAETIMLRTHRWLIRSIEAYTQKFPACYEHSQALFGIVQGGRFEDLRQQSAAFVVAQACHGIALGGESIGFDMDKTREILQWVRPILPEQKVRYAMGVGLHPQNLIDVVAEGVDIFDCVAPTRNARHGSLYVGKIVQTSDWIHFEADAGHPQGTLLIKKERYAHDEQPIMPGCTCYTCKNYTRAYLHFLFKTDALVYTRLACIHNVSVMQAVCQAMRHVMHNRATIESQ
jgi:queuine tRNA-ribosyltransferase